MSGDGAGDWLERRKDLCFEFLHGVPDAALRRLDAAAKMFRAYLCGDETAALAFADEVQAACNRGRVWFRGNVYRGYDEQIPLDEWGDYGPPGLMWHVVIGLFREKYGHFVVPREAETLSLAEVCANTEEDLLRLYNVGPVTVRLFRGWLAERGLRLRGE